MKRLIVTADDFGMARSINEGIARAYSDGIVTSVALLPAGAAFDDAIRIARELKIDQAGAHLALTEVRPDLPPHHTNLFLQLVSKKIRPDELYAELKSQLEAAFSTGIKINNISSHEHVHMFPAILEIFIRLAKEFGIDTIRYPHGDRPVSWLEAGAIYRSAVLNFFSPGMKRAFAEAGIRHPDYFMGFIDSGRLTAEDILIHMIRSLKDGTTELVCHPGFLGPEVLDKHTFHINCEAELAALTSKHVKMLIEASDVKLVNFSEVHGS